MFVPRTFTAALIAASLGVAGLAGAVSATQEPSNDGQNRRVRIHNQTGLALQKLQAADVRTATFGPDLLAGTPVAAGASVPVTIDDGAGGCLYDLRAQLVGGETLLR